MSLEVFGWHTTVELPQVPLHDTPHVLNVVRGAKVAIAVVAALVRVAVELQVMVASMGVSQEETVTGYLFRQKQLEGVLGPVGDDLEAEPPGIPFNSTNHHGLVAVASFPKEALIYLDNAGESVCCHRQQGPKPFVPSTYGCVAHTYHQASCARALALLPTPEQHKQLTVAEFAASKPGGGLGTDFYPTAWTPAVVPAALPGNPAVAAGTGWLVAQQVVHHLLTPGFARNIC